MRYQPLVDQLGATLGGNEPALAAISQSLQQQAKMLAYIDIFHLLAWAALLMIPLAFLLPKAPLGGAPRLH